MSKKLAHGIDLTAPGGIAELFAFHRATFGEAVMEDNGDEDNQDPKGGKGGDNTDPAAEVEKWKALARKNEARSKENADKAKRFDELEEASKSDLEKANARAEAAEKALAERNTKDELDNHRADIAKEYGLDASVLRGGSRDDLEEHAKTLQPFFKKDKAPSADGAGNAGDKLHEKDELSADDIVTAATQR